MEEEQFFVPDYGEDLQTEGEEGDESLTEGVEIVGEYVVLDELPEVEIVGEYIVVDELPEEELLVVDQVGETDEMPPMLFRDTRVVVRRSKKDRRKTGEIAPMSYLRYQDHAFEKACVAPSRVPTLVVLVPNQGLLVLQAPWDISTRPPSWDVWAEERAFVRTEGGTVLLLAFQGAASQVSHTVVCINSSQEAGKSRESIWQGGETGTGPVRSSPGFVAVTETESSCPDAAVYGVALEDPAGLAGSLQVADKLSVNSRRPSSRQAEGGNLAADQSQGFPF